MLKHGHYGLQPSAFWRGTSTGVYKHFLSLIFRWHRLIETTIKFQYDMKDSARYLNRFHDVQIHLNGYNCEFWKACKTVFWSQSCPELYFFAAVEPKNYAISALAPENSI